MFSVTYSLRFIYAVFFGPPPMDLPQQPPSLPSWMLLPVALLVCACPMVGIFPADTAGQFLGAAVRAVVGPDVPAYSLEVWHGKLGRASRRERVCRYVDITGGTV